nr:integrase, catalytic region, zinc finger, CCHC-type, peptidase aspartic, catalytic [Tanacetum cinerariifolium]
RNTCFIRDLDGVDLLKGNRSTNLYAINLIDMASASPICLMARATPTKSWLCHQRLSHLNFNTINDLAINDLVSGLPKFKYAKEHLYPSCEQGRSKRASHPPKPVSNSKQWLHLLHMDLCGPMRVTRINGKRNVVVPKAYSSKKLPHKVDEKLDVPGHMLGTTQVDAPQTNLDNLQETQLNLETVFTLENVSSDTVTASSTGLVRTTKTRRPQPKGNTKNARVPSASKSSEVKKNEKEYAVLWNNWYTKCEECKYDKISYDKAYNDMQQKVKRLQAQLRDLKGKSSDTPSPSNTLDPLNRKLESKIVELEFQVVNYEHEINHLKATYKNLFDSITSNRAHAKLHNLSYENAQLRAWVFENTSEFMNNTSWMSVTPHVDKPKLSVVTFHSKKLHASMPSPSVLNPENLMS